ncbi:hypothetical protein ACLOJK_039748 [Asimina triloba]
MVRFSCFPTPIHYYKSKKSGQRSPEAFEHKFPDSSPDLIPTVSGSSSGSNLQKPKGKGYNHSGTSIERMTSSSSFDCCLKSEEMNSSFSPGDGREVLHEVGLKKSQSLGSGLDKEGRIHCDIGLKDEPDHDLSCDGFHEKNIVTNIDRICDAFDDSHFTEPFDVKVPATYVLNPSQETVIVESFNLNDGHVSKESIFSIGDPHQIDMQEDSCMHVSVEHAGDFAHCTPNTSDRMARIRESCSLPNLNVCNASQQGGFKRLMSGSVGDLLSVGLRGEFPTKNDELHPGVALNKSISAPSCCNLAQASHSLDKGELLQEISGEDCVVSNPSGSYEVTDQDRDHVFESEMDTADNQFGDGNVPVNFQGLIKDWPISEIEEMDVQDSTCLPSKELNMKRIEEWISNIDLGASCTLQEPGECSDSAPTASKDSMLTSGVTVTKFDQRTTPGPGVEVANNHGTSLSSAAASAQMANLGLVAIPFLSPFNSLRVLNLSGNSIVRITAGVLPRGLHMLNLSKNNISTIEGLRDLTRLRVLDLSYNRIFRIGHGLASCSSLKELYLAGNKIGEVEGLHRLLKMNVLDLRFNKISTAKSLGQLAANYSSLQIINLEGNPAQRNIGDDQLKKYLLSLLPHLVYFNRQTIKSSSLKEIADHRPSRAMSGYQLERGLRSEHKLPRRGSYGLSSHKGAAVSSSISHSRSSQRSRGVQHGRPPPALGRRGSQHLNISSSSRIQDLPSSHSIRRTRSEGTLMADISIIKT